MDAIQEDADLRGQFLRVLRQRDRLAAKLTGREATIRRLLEERDVRGKDLRGLKVPKAKGEDRG